MVYKYDFLIIGSGVAGMSYALKVARAHKGKVCMICKTSLDEANTSFAQGGVASVTNLEVDNFDKHIQDTMIAGDYISDYKAVKQVVTMAPEQIKELVQWGVNFDKQQDGKFDLHREGGHSEFRILHHADDTGAEIQRGLMEAVRNCPNIDIKENHFAVEIITQHHLGARVTRRTPYINCYGAYVLNPDTQKVDTYLSKVTVMCTGGCGAVYQTTTNPVIATGDGEAMVYRAKGTVADMEFVQFHPTALYHPGETHPAFLITEAMRGYGGILRLPNGESFMEKYDKRLSLAPRDIVARAIDKEMKIHGLDHVCLDVTHKNPEETKRHFPNIYAKCLSIGIDITKEYIPVRPAAHYMCGGIKVDLNGCSSINRLYALGECSCTGLHGGNRLASNSLIEAVVYAETAAKHSIEHVDEYDFNEKVPAWNDEGTLTNEEKVLITQSVKEVGECMSNYVGIVRSDLRLKRAWDRLDLLYEETENLFKRVKVSKELCELRNMINVGYLITRMAIERKESRGLHYTIPAEFVYPQLFHKRGVLSAARLGDEVNPKRESSGSQFYIVWGKTYKQNELKQIEKQMGMQMEQNIFNQLAKEHHDEIMNFRRNRDCEGLMKLQDELVDETKKHCKEQGYPKFTEEQQKAYTEVGGTPFLDNQYTVFGEVEEGLDIVEKIQNCETLRGDRPKEDVSMQISVIEE